MENPAVTYTGGCQCGAVKFQASGAPKFVSKCHCNSCRKATGAAFSTWVGFADGQVRWLKAAPSIHASSLGAARGFCAACGAPLTYAGEAWPGEIHILIGAFDNPNAFTPDKDVFTEDALDWALAAKD